MARARAGFAIVPCEPRRVDRGEGRGAAGPDPGAFMENTALWWITLRSYHPCLIAELQCVVLDCPEPSQLSNFYQALIGGSVDRPDRRWTLGENWATLHTPSGVVLAFQRAADHQPPSWPNPERPQQLHLDLAVPDLDRAQREVLALGATLLDEGPKRAGLAGLRRPRRPSLLPGVRLRRRPAW